MTWLLVALLASLVLAAAVWLFKVGPGGREALAAALVLGIAGYALQGQPNLPGSPTAARLAEASEADAAAVETRREVAPPGGSGTQWLVIADAMARNGNFGGAAEVLRGAVAKDPGNADAWLAMAVALVSHADGQISPAAFYAFGRAEAAAPENPGIPLFLGQALAQSGRIEEGRKVWADLLARTPEDAQWRAGLVERLDQLDAFIAQRQAAAQAGQ